MASRSRRIAQTRFDGQGKADLIITASAPGRCGIAGNPSDIYGGKVLSCSLPARATCRLTVGGEGLPEDLTLWKAATARYPLDGVRVEWSSDVPRSSGLAGSTALLAATLACILKARGEAPDELQTPAFAELVRDIERNEAGVMCGYQDAYMVVHGGLRLMNFAGKHPVNPGPDATLEDIGRFGPQLPFLLITTGVERLSGSVHGPMADRWLAGDREVVETMLHLAKLPEIAAGALMSRDYPVLAEVMTDNQARIAALGGSGDAIDSLISDCLDCGAMSAKLAGAGMGGTVLALGLDLDDLENQLREKGYSRFIRPEVCEGVRLEVDRSGDL